MSRAGPLVSREAVAGALEARAAAVLRSAAPERLQPHSRRLPTESEIAQAAFAARQLRAAADDLRAGLEESDTCGEATERAEGPQGRTAVAAPAAKPSRADARRPAFEGQDK